MKLPKIPAIRRGKDNTPPDMMLKPRRMQFELKSAPRYWANGDPVKTHFLNAVSTILPQGEDFFIRKLRENFHRISDKDLQGVTRKFCGQEAHHANEHRTFNEHLSELYPKLPMLEKALIAYVNFMSSITDDDTDLAYVANTEHMTAIMGHVLLRDADYWLEDRNMISSLFFWHVVEEVEHKSVAYDVYENVSGSYLKRVLWMPVVVGTVANSILANQLYMLHVDGELKKLSTWKNLVNMYWGKEGVGKEIFNLEFWKYMLPNYHPWDLDDRHLIKKWEARYEEQEDLRSVVIDEVMYKECG